MEWMRGSGGGRCKESAAIGGGEGSDGGATRGGRDALQRTDQGARQSRGVGGGGPGEFRKIGVKHVEGRAKADGD